MFPLLAVRDEPRDDGRRLRMRAKLMSVALVVCLVAGLVLVEITKEEWNHFETDDQPMNRIEQRTPAFAQEPRQGGLGEEVDWDSQVALILSDKHSQEKHSHVRVRNGVLIPVHLQPTKLCRFRRFSRRCVFELISRPFRNHMCWKYCDLKRIIRKQRNRRSRRPTLKVKVVRVRRGQSVKKVRLLEIRLSRQRKIFFQWKPFCPTRDPSPSPTKNPTTTPTMNPSATPTRSPTRLPTKSPSGSPTKNPTKIPTKAPSSNPTEKPTATPSNNPSRNPTNTPTTNPTRSPSGSPTKNPTKIPTNTPSVNPTKSPTKKPTRNPTGTPSRAPSQSPTKPTVEISGSISRLIGRVAAPVNYTSLKSAIDLHGCDKLSIASEPVQSFGPFSLYTPYGRLSLYSHISNCLVEADQRVVIRGPTQTQLGDCSQWSSNLTATFLANGTDMWSDRDRIHSTKSDMRTKSAWIAVRQADWFQSTVRVPDINRTQLFKVVMVAGECPRLKVKNVFLNYTLCVGRQYGFAIFGFIGNVQLQVTIYWSAPWSFRSDPEILFLSTCVVQKTNTCITEWAGSILGVPFYRYRSNSVVHVSSGSMFPPGYGLDGARCTADDVLLLI